MLTGSRELVAPASAGRSGTSAPSWEVLWDSTGLGCVISASDEVVCGGHPVRGEAQHMCVTGDWGGGRGHPRFPQEKSDGVMWL